MFKFKNYNLNRFKKAGLISLLLFLIFSLSGCGLMEKLEQLDEKVGKTFNNFEEDKNNTIMDIIKEKEKTSTTSENEITANDLSKKEKENIDKWLKDRGLNRYGDAPNAVYTGGTPLFNEKTGNSIDRYDYILNKFPNILELIDLLSNR